MENFLIGLHITVSVILIGIVLIQSGKGAELGASLGAGSSQTIFGSSGGATFFTRATAVLATIFMLTSIGLTYIKAQEHNNTVFDKGITLKKDAAPAEGTTPATGDAAKEDASKK